MNTVEFFHITRYNLGVRHSFSYIAMEVRDV